VAGSWGNYSQPQVFTCAPGAYVTQISMLMTSLSYYTCSPDKSQICHRSQGACGSACYFLGTIKAVCSDGKTGVLDAQPSNVASTQTPTSNGLVYKFDANSWQGELPADWAPGAPGCWAAGTGRVVGQRLLASCVFACAPMHHLLLACAPGLRRMKMDYSQLVNDYLLRGPVLLACPDGTAVVGISVTAHGYPTGALSNLQHLCAAIGVSQRCPSPPPPRLPPISPLPPSQPMPWVDSLARPITSRALARQISGTCQPGIGRLLCAPDVLWMTRAVDTAGRVLTSSCPPGFGSTYCTQCPDGSVSVGGVGVCKPCAPEEWADARSTYCYRELQACGSGWAALLLWRARICKLAA
jgi:hypothetical protein